ncbi:hypothetical protein BSKO_08848 [Bryopsis sp. KO-2023]|nr:hypothetical protein BSKO_08848 [Bryopsis sp. KO-2023]
MAKLGEGDPRWIVEARPDGTNVHNWHWKEKDALPWTRDTLGKKLAELDLLGDSGPLFAKTDGLESATGEAFINVRKNKIIASYELEVKIKWKGEVKDGEGGVVGQGKGMVHLPYVADENSDETPEARVTVEQEKENPAGGRLREAILAKGMPKIQGVISEFVSDLRAGGPAAGEASGAPSPALQATSSTNSADQSQDQIKTPAPEKPSPKPKESKKKVAPGNSRTSLKIRHEFYASPRDIYECFVNAGKFQAFTMSPAKIEAHPGGEFSWFGGSVAGRFKELQPNERIVMDWRFNNWVEGCYSEVVMNITSPQEGTTVVNLSQTGIPEEDQFGNENVKSMTENGWTGQIMTRIRAVFGYGL